jgi:membrane protein implicated in regulation of membrane protease activity
MFWISALAVGLAVGLFQLGEYSVWMVLMSLALKVAMLFIAGLIIALLWKKFQEKSGNLRKM